MSDNIEDDLDGQKGLEVDPDNESPDAGNHSSTGTPARNQRDLQNEEIALLLAQGLTHATTAKIVGISTKTIQRRLKDEDFKQYLLEKRRERLSATTERLIQLSDSAVDTIREVMGSENDALRLRAAQTLLNLGRRHHKEEVTEWALGARVDAIERALAAEEADNQSEDLL